jgi:hypothetical protein
LSFTAEGFVGFCTGGSKENEFCVWETIAQALRPIVSPADTAAKSKRHTFIRIAKRAACAPPGQGDNGFQNAISCAADRAA